MKLLDHKFFSHPVIASDKFYYGTYPYKIEFNPAKFENRRSLISFRRQIEDFQSDLIHGLMRTNISYNIVRFYFVDYTDFLLTYNVFSESINFVQGPISKQHLEILTTPDFKVVKRSDLWLKKYNCRVYVTFKNYLFDNYIANAMLIPLPTPVKSEQLDLNKELMSMQYFFDDNLSSVSIRKNCTLFCDYADIVDIIPFFYLQFPKARLIIEKVFID